VGRQRRWTTDKRQSLRTIAPIHQQNCHPDRSEAQWRDLQFGLTCNKICFIPGGRQRRWMTDKKQVLIKLPLVFGTAGSTTNRRGAPSFAFFAKGGIRDRRYRDSWYPTLRKMREGPRISYCAAPAMAACAAFYKESRMKFVDPSKPYRKSGGMGHPEICCTFCRGQELPRFISRGSATPVDD